MINLLLWHNQTSIWWILWPFKSIKVWKKHSKSNQNSDHFFILSNFQPQSWIKGVITLLKWGSVLFTSSVQYLCMLWWTLLSKLRCYLGDTNCKTVPAQRFFHFFRSGALAYVIVCLSVNKTPRYWLRLWEMYSRKAIQL